MITNVSFNEFARLAVLIDVLRSAVRKLHDDRRSMHPVLLDVLRYADTVHTAGAARGCLIVARSENQLLAGLAAIVDAQLPPEARAALRARLLDLLREDLGDLREFSNEELGSLIRSLLTIHAGGELDTLSRMANDVANDIATSVAER
jgi:hypothetical protein